jgi:hypothetical protein
MFQLLSLREGKRPSELDADSNPRPLLCPLDPPPPLISDAEKGMSASEAYLILIQALLYQHCTHMHKWLRARLYTINDKINEYGALCVMILRKTKVLEERMSQCHLVDQKFHMAWDWSQLPMVTGQWLTMLAMVQPDIYICHICGKGNTVATLFMKTDYWRHICYNTIIFMTMNSTITGKI